MVIRRTDYRPYPGVAVLTGRLSAARNSIENGTIRWTYHPCCALSSGTFQAAWGTAIQTVPGSDQERTQMNRQTQPQHQQAAAQTPPPPPVSPEERALRTQICTSRQIRGAMRSVEDAAVKDPNGALLSALAGLIAGVDASAGSATILDSKNSSDWGPLHL